MDRDLPAAVVQKALVLLKFDARFDGDFLVVRRQADGLVIYKLHLPKGPGDRLRRLTVRNLYRHTLDIPTDLFYEAVAKIESE